MKYIALITVSCLLSGCSISELQPWGTIKETIRWATIETYKLIAISLVLYVFSFLAQHYERKLIKIVIFVIFLDGIVEIIWYVFS